MNRISLSGTSLVLGAALLLGTAEAALSAGSGVDSAGPTAAMYRLVDPVSRHIRSWYLRELGIAGEDPAEKDLLGWPGSRAGLGSLGGAPIGFRAVLGYAAVDDDAPPGADLAERYRILLGFDIAPRDDWVLGIVLGYSDADVEAESEGGTGRNFGFSIAPYVALSLGSLSLDLSVGYSNLVGDDLGAAPYARSGVDVLPLGIAQLPGERRPWQLGADVGYTIGNWKPYVSGMVEHDLSEAGLGLDPSGRTGPSGMLGFGVHYLGDTGLSGTLGYDATLGREFDDHRINLFIRSEFD